MPKICRVEVRLLLCANGCPEQDKCWQLSYSVLLNPALVQPIQCRLHLVLERNIGLLKCSLSSTRCAQSD